MTEELAGLDPHYESLIDDLVTEFADVHSRSVVQVTFAAARAELETGARVLTYLPVLTAKVAHDRLAKAAAGPGREETS